MQLLFQGFVIEILIIDEQISSGAMEFHWHHQQQAKTQTKGLLFIRSVRQEPHKLHQTIPIPVERGLSDDEFSSIESCFSFNFPPDLRSILREGLPVGSGFPNWRSSSAQQLEILTSLPILGLCKEVGRNDFWLPDWGRRPEDIEDAVILAKGLLRKAPTLVPIYRHFYIPSVPCLAGNPVFYVNGGEVKAWSFDIAGFFQKVEFGPNETLLSAPAWAAMEARRVEFWMELEERTEGRGSTGWWWSGDLSGCLEGVCLRLRDGGWTEEDVREMLIMDGEDERRYNNTDEEKVLKGRDGMESSMKALSMRLLSAGWSTEDVVNSLGVSSSDDSDSNHEWREVPLDFDETNARVRVGDLDGGDKNKSITKWINLHSIKV